MEKFIIANGTAIRISDSATEGPVVVLLHGYMENLSVWDDFSALLGPGVRVIAPDLPGHGISEVKGPIHTMEFLADTVHEVLLQLNAVKCCVIGHSMGGYVALALAARHPEILSGLVLFSSTPNPDSEAKKADREREIALIEAGKKELLSRVTPGKMFAAANRARFADEMEDLAELIQLTEDEGITALLRGMEQRADQNEMLHKLPVPQMFIFGRHDEFIPVEIAEKVIAAQPQARVVWLENSGHMGFIEQPAEAVNAIHQFMHDNNLNNK